MYYKTIHLEFISRNMVRATILLIVVCMFFTPTLFAQQTITLKDALLYAVENSETTRQAKYDIETGRQQVNETRASALPQINGTSTITNNPKVMSFVFPADVMGGPPGSFAAIRAGQTWGGQMQVTLSQQVYNQQIFSGLKAAKESVELYELASQVSEETVLQQVATTYYQYVVTRQNMNVLDANIYRVNELEKILVTQVDNGLVRKIDLDRVRVNKTNLEAQKIELNNGLIQLENLLKYYMGMPVDTKIEIPETAIGELEKYTQAIIDSERLNVENLLTMRLLNKQSDLLNIQTRVHRAGYAPFLFISGHYTYSTQSNNFDLYSGKALSFDMAAVTLNLNIPIFDGLEKRAKVKSSEIQLKKLNEQIMHTQNALTMSYNNAKLQISNSLKTIEVQQANRELAKEVYEITESNYKLGLSSLTDLITAETELRTAENSYNEALLNYKVAEIELLKAKGDIGSLLN